MPIFRRNHIIFENRTETLPYTSTQSGRTKVIPRTNIDRIEQGNSVREYFNAALADFKRGEDVEYVYVVFKSPWDFILDIDKLDKNNFRLSSYKSFEAVDDEGQIHTYYEATVCLNHRAITDFLTRVELYINKNTKKGNPKQQALIANIDEIRAATLESFWQEPEIPFPTRSENVWWEIWLNREPDDNLEEPLRPFVELLNNAQVQIGRRYLKFAEHWVFLMKATVEQLGASLLYTDRLAEIRKPKDTAEFFTLLDVQEQAEWICDLTSRTDNLADQNIISVCLLDTGVNRINPLLVNLIPERNLDTVEPGWTKADKPGHGTPMAGLSLYGDLSDILGTNERIQIYHHLESVKLIDDSHPHDPEVYGAVTQEAIARAETIHPEHKRIVCMAITSDAFIHKGRPSSWSAAIDQSLFGSVDNPNDNTIFFVSSGNLLIEERINYPLANNDCSIKDPAQAFNAITVGAYTLKDHLHLELHPGAELLAKRGGMSPCNTTSFGWNNDWCRKPDIVMEGGNQAISDGGIVHPDAVQLLSTAKGGLGRTWLKLFGDTSAATALASKFAAELYFLYPTLWPETIRGLIIHSADWTPEMLNNRSINELIEEEHRSLLSQVGYGVPSIDRAKYSANNSLSLIAERVLKPYKEEDNRIKTDEFHLFDLPWPVDVLQELFNTEVRVTITLSYFIEPNPGQKRYELSTSYRSHGLRFKMIDKDERPGVFKSRVSKAMREGEYEKEGGEHWILGNKIRDKGSIHKDIWQGTAIDLSTRNKIAVYPVGGWWKNRKNQNRFNNTIRYSLIVTIDAPLTDIDIYTPVLNQIEIEV